MEKIFKYGFVFSFSLFVLIYFSGLNSYDSIWNYSFSYAISHGQIPFLEINMITPGFYNFLMSLGLLISHNNIVFLIEQAFLVMVAFIFLDKLYGNKSFLFLVFMCFSSFYAFCPTYNYLLLVLTIIIVYMEERKKSDFLIGVFLGLLILTKHTVGVFLIIPSIIICYKKKKRLGYRFLGLLVPFGIYLLYLFFSHSFWEFLDLCVFGLFDFLDYNTEIIPIYFISSLLLLIISIIYVIKYPRDIVGYYVLFFFFIMIPIFSYYHFYVYLVMVSLLLQKCLTLSSKYIRNFSIFFCIVVVLLNFFAYSSVGEREFLHIHNFDYLYLSKKSKEQFLLLNRLYLKYQRKDSTQILSSKNPWIKITNEEDLDYFSVFLYGNFGYHGNEKMIQKIKDAGNCYYILDSTEYQENKNNRQFASVIVEYILKHSDFVESVDCYDVYYYKG